MKSNVLARVAWLVLLLISQGSDRYYLDGNKSLQAASVATRISWASGQVSSRIEDTAFGLEGILDVNFPFFYGEGEKAFTSLQSGIIQSSNDSSIMMLQ